MPEPTNDARFRHRVEFFAYDRVRRFLHRRPHAAVRRFGHRLGRFGHRVLGSKRRLVLDNLALALPERDEAERRRICRACFEHVGSYFCELVSAERFSGEELAERFTLEGAEHVEELERSGQGYFFLASHYGSWEVGGRFLGHYLQLQNERAGWPRREGGIQMVVRPPSNPLVDRDFRQARERLGNRLIAKHRAAYRMLKLVLRGERVGIAMDQRVRPELGIQMPFMGQPAWTSPVLAALSIRTGAPVVPTTSVPVGDDRYRMELRAPILPEGEGKEAEEALTRRYVQETEEEIRRRPELWLWMHRRWRR